MGAAAGYRPGALPIARWLRCFCAWRVPASSDVPHCRKRVRTSHDRERQRTRSGALASRAARPRSPPRRKSWSPRRCRGSTFRRSDPTCRCAAGRGRSRRTTSALWSLTTRTSSCLSSCSRRRGRTSTSTCSSTAAPTTREEEPALRPGSKGAMAGTLVRIVASLRSRCRRRRRVCRSRVAMKAGIPARARDAADAAEPYSRADVLLTPDVEALRAAARSARRWLRGAGTLARRRGRAARLAL